MLRRKSRSWGWLVALAAIFSVSAAIYLTTYWFDAARVEGIGLADLLFSAGAQDALGNMPEVIAGVLGITITVVAIIVELAANRYTPRITELFVQSPVNLAVLGFFVVTGLIAIWVSITGSAAGFVPRAGTVVTVSAITVCLLLLLPYFSYVFVFLEPRNIIDHMARSSLRALHRGGRSEGGEGRHKRAASRGIEQLADVALNAVESKDKVICMHAIDALGALMRRYLGEKERSSDAWFEIDTALRENPDFVSMHDEVLEDVERGRYWVEMKVLRQYQMLYGETLNRMRDINYLIAINTRKIAEEAIERGDRQLTALAVKFFNTYMRSTINGRDVRTAYNVFNQYRLLAEYALRACDEQVAMETARRFQYYGQLGFAGGLAFVLETAAYDLCTLNELAFELDSPCRDELLSIFLEVDKEAEEGHELEASLRGVRKAQIKLATFYLTRGADDLARAIFDDIRGELPSRLTSIREELASITSREFWEINDRGVNFDYIEPERRAELDRFFGWFGERDPAHQRGE